MRGVRNRYAFAKSCISNRGLSLGLLPRFVSSKDLLLATLCMVNVAHIVTIQFHPTNTISSQQVPTRTIILHATSTLYRPLIKRPQEMPWDLSSREPRLAQCHLDPPQSGVLTERSAQKRFDGSASASRICVTFRSLELSITRTFKYQS